ncbi:MAG: hypothetical protein AB7G65_20205 [Thermoleophilia bacterium]
MAPEETPAARAAGGAAPAGATGGTCYGFAIDSPLAFRFLRHGDGDPLRVVDHHEDGDAGAPLLMEWFPGEGVALHARLHADDLGRFRLWIDTVGWYLVDPARREIAVPADEDPLRREERLWGLPALLCFLARGDTSVHAAAVQIGDGALLVGAPSGHGKSTLAAAFWREGHRLLSDDLSCIRHEGGGPVVVPGPALMRLRPDMAAELGVTAMPEAHVTPDRVRLRPAEDLVGDCAPVPLRGIVLLGEPTAEMSMEPVAPTAAIPELWPLRFSLPGREAEGACFEGIAALADSVPVWRLHRPLTVAALPDVVRFVADHA